MALRQTLAQSPIFQRVPRRKEEPGGWSDMWRLHPDVRSKLHDFRFLENSQQTPSRSSIFAPKLIIQSVVKSNDKTESEVEAELAPNQLTENNEKESSPSQVDGGSDLLSNNFKEEEMNIDEELRLDNGWWTGALADLEETNSDPCARLDSPTQCNLDTPKSPLNVQPWVDDRLNLEELDTILGLN